MSAVVLLQNASFNCTTAAIKENKFSKVSNACNQLFMLNQAGGHLIIKAVDDRGGKELVKDT